MSHAAYQGLMAVHRWLDTHPPWFTVIKVAIFGALALTSTLYIVMDIRAADVTLHSDSSFIDWVNMFAISVDYVAWYGLLLLYELETSALDDDALTGRWRWVFSGLSLVLYVLVFWALVGYLGKLWLVVDYAPLGAGDLCSWPEPLVVMRNLDDFFAVTAQNCAALNQAQLSGHLFALNQEPIIFDVRTYYGLGGAWSLAWADALEAVLWIAVLAQIQVEIMLQVRGRLSSQLLARSQRLKSIFYVLIIALTAYYSLFGRALDLYDSVLWLLAFLLIEINITGWNEEQPEAAVPAPDCISS